MKLLELNYLVDLIFNMQSTCYMIDNDPEYALWRCEMHDDHVLQCMKGRLI